MPFLEKAGCKLHYALTGAANSPVVVFSNSLGTNFSMWDPQVPALEKKFRVLRYDTRGHGQSSVTPGPYSIEQLARDVITLLDGLKIERANFCGLSMGGMTGMALGLDFPARIEKLVLSNTAAKIGTPEFWNARIEKIRRDGMKAIASGVIEKWFTPEFRARCPQAAQSALQMLEECFPEGYVANCAAVRDFDARSRLSQIHAPTLVISGTSDPSTPPADGRFLADHLPAARYIELAAAHISNIEAEEEFTAGLIGFLSS